MLSFPAGSAEVVKLAVPDAGSELVAATPESVAEPRDVVPFMNVTVPEGAAPALVAATVVENVIGAPTLPK
jgi:hypothetical protein